MAHGTVERFKTMGPDERVGKLAAFEAQLPRLAANVRLYQCLGRVANETGYWIVARRTNPEALPYIGNPMYTPKGISCKAKTAKHNGTATVGGRLITTSTAGLVTDPTLVPTAFGPGALPQALPLWHAFAREKLGTSSAFGYSVDHRPGSRHYGCLMKHGKWVHGDLDLFDVVKPAAVGARPDRIRHETVEDEKNVYSEATRIIGNRINATIGAPIVQHGAQAHYGDFDSEALDVFAPDGRMFALPTRTHARGWYLLRWPGRASAAALRNGDVLFRGAEPFAPG